MRVLLLLLLLCVPVVARPTAQEVFDRWLAQDRLQAAHVGFLLVRVADGQVLASHDADKLFVPASTAKVMTAKGVLEAGSAPELSTEVWQRGGELVLWGNGDPELSSHELRELAQIVARDCPREVQRLSVGATAWDDINREKPLGRGWAWDDATEDYSAVICGLTADRGTILVKVAPQEDARPQVTVPPGLTAPVNRAASRGDVEETWRFVRVPGQDGTELLGYVSRPFETRIASAEPDLDAGRILAAELERLGVTVKQVSRLPFVELVRWHLARQQPATQFRGTLLATHTSRPIEAILREALARSDNLAMELLIRVATGKPAPPSPPTARLVDGSGLSRYNLLSPRHLVEALQSSAKLRDLMPLAGVEGTLKNRLKDGLAFRQVRAKTGTVSTVSGLAGTLFPDEPDKACVFALLTNGFTGPGRELKQAEDVLIEELVRRLAYPYVLGK